MKNQIFFKLSKINLSKLLFILICTVSTFGLYGQNVQMTLVESWENSTWENSGRSMNTYDSNNYLITIINQMWDVNSSTWENAARTLYTNNINGTVSLMVIQIWDTDTNGWNDSYRTTYTYTSFNKVSTAISDFGWQQ